MEITRKRRIIDMLLLVLVAGGGYFAVQNAAAIGDWWHFLRYEPPEKIEQLAEDAGMSEAGARLFYRFSPTFQPQTEIDELCGSHALGCSVGSSIYILQESDSADRYRSIVTAAHEMLHVAYSRFDNETKRSVKAQLDAELGRIDNRKIFEQLAKFEGTDDYLNEAHSYIGSQEDEITSELKEHYQTYFSERMKTIEAYRKSPEH